MFVRDNDSVVIKDTFANPEYRGRVGKVTETNGREFPLVAFGCTVVGVARDQMRPLESRDELQVVESARERRQATEAVSSLYGFDTDEGKALLLDLIDEMGEAALTLPALKRLAALHEQHENRRAAAAERRALGR